MNGSPWGGRAASTPLYTPALGAVIVNGKFIYLPAIYVRGVLVDADTCAVS